MGNAVKEFASDNAEVVIGTVIDPDLQDELRVTVVATGLSNHRQQQEPHLKLVHKHTGEIDYDQLQHRPAISRKQPKLDSRASENRGKEIDLEYLDIPAFLRRQAD